MKRKVIMILLGIFLCLICLFLFLIVTNKTFLKTVYIGKQNQEIFIPRFSYFQKECCFTAATFFSLKSKKQLQKEIDNYLKEFTFFENNETYGYQKGDLFIQKYEIEEYVFYRKIIITY